MKKWVLRLLALLAIALVSAALYLMFCANRYQNSGAITLSILDAPVSVQRDALAIPYIKAKSLADALRAQGFITGQDRLYQAQLYRLLALGRLAEVFGERALSNDTLIRVVGIKQMAIKQTAALDDQARDYFQHYIEGLNAYIRDHQDEHPLAVKALGFPNEEWTVQDIVAVQLFQTWANGSNWRMDVLTQQLINTLGVDKVQQISQVSINPDDESIAQSELTMSNSTRHFSINADLFAALPNALAYGSNAWATGAQKSESGKPIFANNPHLPATTLPGFWHPMGLFTPELKAVGVAAPGSPGIGVGRTEHIAYGATVGGSDGADLYIEELSGKVADHYLQGEELIPLVIRNEVVKVRDDGAARGYREELIRIRATQRGPLISDHGIQIGGNKAVSIRWAVATEVGQSMGSDRLIRAQTVEQAREALKSTAVALSHIIVDRTGGIARISSGRVPIRLSGDGASAVAVAQLGDHDFDNWRGLIPLDEMPMNVRPAQDWVGTANHRLVKHDYPYEFSKIFASSWRYRRIKEFMESKSSLNVKDHWALINDVKNPLAVKLVPLFIDALKKSPEHQQLAKILADWNYLDTVDQIAPSLFQQLYIHLAELTFKDDIPSDLWPSFFDSVYFWQERWVLMLQQNDNAWFDLQTTPEVENLDALLQIAIDAAVAELKSTLGPAIDDWQWGKLHTITFSSPVVPGKTMAKLFGAGTHPMTGSGQTLNRGAFKMSKRFDVDVIDSVRLVADMADDEKILAVLPGGTSARYFDPSLANQVEHWLRGQANYIWFSETAVDQHAISNLSLLPN